MKRHYFTPLLSLQIPNAIISVALFVLDQPPPPIQLAGYVFFNVMVCVTYWLGVRAVVLDVGASRPS